MELKQTKIRLASIKVKSFVTSTASNESQLLKNQLNTDYTWVGQ